jgi:hypothetical protein
MVAIVGALAFVVDLGFQMETRRELQNAADAGALAGVVLLPNDQTGSMQQATTFAYQGANAAITDRICGAAANPLPDPGATAPGAHPHVYAIATPGQKAVDGGYIYTMTVTMECTSQFSFGRILNLLQTPIRASATAAIGGLADVNCPIPFGLVSLDTGTIEEQYANNFGYTPGVLYDLKVDNSNQPAPGNFQILCLDPGHCGGSDVQNWLSGNTCVPIKLNANGTLDTTGGNKTGNITGGTSSRGFTKSGNVYTCPDTLSQVVDTTTWQVKDNSSVCLGVVPVLAPNAYNLIQGSKPVPVVGFAVFFMQQWDQGTKTFTGYFVKATLDGDITAYTQGAPTAIRLIQ